MNVNISLDKNAAKKLEEASNLLGVEEKDVVRRAVFVYLDELDKALALKKEWVAWDRASDEALADFEKSL